MCTSDIPTVDVLDKASDNKTKNGRARVSRSEVTLKNGDGNKANVNTVAAGKVLCSNEPGKTNNAQEKIEVNLLNKQTPRNIENIFYKQINDCMKNIKNTSLLVDVVQAAGIQDGRRYSKYRTIPRKKMAHDKNNSSPKGGTICYEFDRNNIIKKRRPQTTPLLQRDTTKFEILRKSTSGNKLIAEKDFLSKIPVLARYLKGKYLIGSINKAKTSPELKFRWYNGQKPNSIKIQQKYVDLWANSAEYCKKVHGKTKIALPEEKSEKICEESGNFSIPFQSIDVKRTSSLQPIMKKPIVSKIPRTISSLTFSSISKVGNDAESIKETCKSQQRIASKIPVGVRSNIGIVKKDLQINDVQNSTPNDNNLPVNKITHTEGLNVPPNKPIECNGNLSKKKLNPIQTHKKGLIDKSKALEAKRGVENMCKRRIHFCCGDRNDDIKVVHKRFPGKVMNKVIKPKKTLNFKHRTALVNNKADLKLVISSPEIIKPIDKDPSPVIEPEKLLVKNVELEEKIKQNKTGDLMISRNVIPFSDTNLLKDKNCIVKSLCLKKRYPDYRSEKYVQTVICNNDIGIQVDYSAKDLQQISKEGKNANVTFGYGDWKFPFSQQEVGSNAHLNAILDYCADLLKTKNDLEEVLMQCSVFENVPSTAIGCQSEELSLKDSFSQTICCATDKSCQCFQTHHSISFTLTTNSQAPHSLKDTSRNKSDFTTANKSQFFLPSRNTSSNVCIAGLDNPDCKYEMACYCKEAPLDQKADIQAERQRNLYEDDEDGEEYSEPYMAELVNTVQLEDETKMCGSMPSLPDVAMPNDRCESKIEIPWLKISLAPPGYYQIKNKEGHPTKVMAYTFRCRKRNN